MSNKPVIVIGAGLSGLCCARVLHSAGLSPIVLEAQDAVGGRVRTDVVNGFRLDHGFQVLQTAYPAAQREFDYSQLRLQPFEPGALIQTRGTLVRMTDPWRRPFQATSTVWNGIGTLSDRWQLARLRARVVRGSLGDLWSATDSTTQEYLRETCGFSNDLIERFFRPWFRGVFLEDDLATSSQFFRFVFRMFALGEAALPAAGMGALAQQLAQSLPAEQIRLNSRVAAIEGTSVRLESGELLSGSAVVLAVEGPAAARLAGESITPPVSRGTACLYFAATAPPVKEGILVLNGDRTSPVNNLCVPSLVSPSYAPAGQALISVSVVGDHRQAEQELMVSARKQLREWYGAQVDRWELQRIYHIPHALPAQPAHFRTTTRPACRLQQGIYACGDYRETACIHGALVSGRLAAETLLADFGLPVLGTQVAASA